MMEKTLREGLTALGLSLPEARQEKLCAFARAMVKQNEVMNLTAITEDTQVAKLHLLDSLTVLCCADLRGKTLIDVGCGAGFPGCLWQSPARRRKLHCLTVWASG